MASRNFGDPDNPFGVYPDKNSGWGNLNPDTLLTAQEEADLMNSGVSGGTPSRSHRIRKKTYYRRLAVARKPLLGTLSPSFLLAPG